MTNLKGKDFDIDSIMCELQNKRKVFHSEDDLKFSLATVIQRQYKYAEVRLERPMNIKMVKKADNSDIPKTISIDITVFLGDDKFFLELKYKTKKLSKDFEKKWADDIKDDVYSLKNQGACDIGRFLFRKDIFRLEKVIEKNKGKGFFIVITNDSGYTDNLQDNKRERIGKMYSFHNNEELVALDPGWNYKKDGAYVSDVKHPDKGDKHWSCRGSMAYKLNLRNEYIINWQKYSEISQQDVEEGKDLIFRHCIIEVNE